MTVQLQMHSDSTTVITTASTTATTMTTSAAFHHHYHNHPQHLQHRHEIQTQIRAYEGIYRQMPMSDYSCPNRVTYSNNPISPPVRLSFISLPNVSVYSDRICFNYGKELYVYVYKGVKKAPDLKRLVEKKIYKGVNPTCHDFNKMSVTNNSVSLLVGLSSGQIQLIDPIRRESCKVYNEERLIDKTKVTCIRWLPGSKHVFLASHASGQLYVYDDELPCNSSAPNYQLYKQGDGYQIQTCKTKNIRNPVYRWLIGCCSEDCCINEFAFSPCGSNLAIASQDGFLRVFNYHNMDLLGFARSYFGGFLCVCWSPDGRYVVVGGQDDLVTVWSFHDNCVLARGQGHKSWVSVVAFDPFMTTYCNDNEPVLNGANEDNENDDLYYQNHSSNTNICYRFGSVGQDTQLCMWDITDEVLNQQSLQTKYNRTQLTADTLLPLSPVDVPSTSSSLSPSIPTPTTSTETQQITDTTTIAAISGNNDSCAMTTESSVADVKKQNHCRKISIENFNSSFSSFTQKLKSFNFGERKSSKKAAMKLSKSSSNNEKVCNSLGIGAGIGIEAEAAVNNCSLSAPISKENSTDSLFKDPFGLIGTAYCPRFDQCPVIEPLVCEKIAQERLTALVFLEDCFVTACQDGCIYTWARPSTKNMNGGFYSRFDTE